MSKIDKNHLWCPIDLVIHVIGSRWTIAIVRELATGIKRPSELARALGKISAKTLTQRLRDLEEWGLVQRIAFQEIPPRVEYSLTDRGRDLLYVLEALKDLGESWQRTLKIDVPPTVKEQCSHCFEYLGRATTDSVPPDSAISQESAYQAGIEKHNNGDSNCSDASDNKLCQKIRL